MSTLSLFLFLVVLFVTLAYYYLQVLLASITCYKTPLFGIQGEQRGTRHSDFNECLLFVIVAGGYMGFMYGWVALGG